MQQTRFNPFGDEPRDRSNMLRWLVKQLNSLSSESLDDDLLAQMDEIYDEIERLDKFLLNNVERTPED